MSSFGATGINAHVIVQEAPIPQERNLDTLPQKHLFVLSAKNKNSLQELIHAYEEYLTISDDSLADICYTAATGRAHFSYRISLIINSKEELLKQLKTGVKDLQEIMLQMKSLLVMIGSFMRRLF